MRTASVLTLCLLAALPAWGTPGRVTLAAVGDVLLARGVAPQIAKRGPEYPLRNVRGLLRSADIAFFNCECTLSKRGLPQRRLFRFHADPALAKALRIGGFNVACLASNHTLDYGRDALLDTIEATKNAGMLPFGAGVDRQDALKVRVVEKNGLRVGFIGYTDMATAGVVRLDDRPTVAGVNDDELAEQVRSAKAKCDVLAVSFHWGTEYAKRPTRRQKMLAHLAIDSGADLVLGHHPHVLQPVETYKGKPILYSMGAFVWDKKDFGANHSAIYFFELTRSKARLVRTVPIRIVNCQPRSKEGHSHRR